METAQNKRRYDPTLDLLEAELFGQPKLIASLVSNRLFEQIASAPRIQPISRTKAHD